MTPAGITSLLNATASTSTSAGALILSDGIGVIKNSFFGGTLNVASTCYLGTTSKNICIGTSTDTTRLISALDSALTATSSTYELCFGQANSTNNQIEHSFYYAGSGLSTNRLLTLQANGTLRINNPPTMSNGTGIVEIQSFGYCLNLINTATYYTRLWTDGAGSFLIETNTAGGAGGYTSHYFSSGSLGLGLMPRSRLDFGNTASDAIITLYQANNLSGTYMLGANNSATKVISAGSNGVQFYYNSASGVGVLQQLGTNIFSMLGNGLCQSKDNIIAGMGLHVNSFSTTGLAAIGNSGHMHYAAGIFSVFGYNYNTSTYIPTVIGANNSIYSNPAGLVGMGTNAPACNLHVVGTTTSGFGWLSGAGTGTATGFTNRQFSIRCSGGIMCDSGEIDVLSDVRLKSNIIQLDDTLCKKFIENINPISFNYKSIKNDKLHYGLSAQELVKYGFDSLVGFTTDENEELEECDIECDGEENIKLEKHTRLVVNLLDMIPILTKALQMGNEKIKINKEEIAELRALLNLKANSRRKK